ncbi:MAG: sulfatase [Phycisphaeraceae bacterium]|nr:sulfatase [Phycisphaeraceae bacterium]
MKHLLCFLLCMTAFPASSDEKRSPPNVLFIIADDLAANALGCYGNEQVLTPNIDRLAARGFTMDRAYCQYPVCGPARAALLSGLYPQQNSVTHNGARDTLTAALGDRPTLPQYFKQNGYTTARCGKLYHMRVPGDITAGVSGPDHKASWTEAYNFRGPEQWTPGKTQMLSGEKIKPDPEQNKHYGLGYGTAFFAVEDPTEGAEQHDAQATGKAIELMSSYKQDGTPFFLAVGYVRPHVPLVAPKKYYEPYHAELMRLPDQVEDDLADIPRAGWSRIGSRSGTGNDGKRRAVLRAYYASVSFMDAQVGRLLDELEKQGLADNTLIVLMSDHGYHLGEHDFWQKLSLHEESSRIPLIAAGPGIEPGKRWNGFMEAVDIYPSMCVFAGLPIPEHCMGLDLVTAKDNPRQTVYTMSNRGHLLRSEGWAYMRYKDGSEELYDMKNDPKQFTNMAKDPASSKVLDRMRDVLDERLKQIEAKP